MIECWEWLEIEWDGYSAAFLQKSRVNRDWSWIDGIDGYEGEGWWVPMSII